MEWPLVRLDSLYDIARGGSPRPIKDYITEEPDGINWVKIGDATASGKFIYETKQKIRPEGIQKSRLVNKDDFILSNSMSFGRPYIMGTSGCIHDGWLVLSAKDDQIDQDFLYHMLGSPFVFNQFDALAAGSTVRNLNIDLVSKVKVPLIPKEEQKRIVALLDTVFADLEQTRAKTEQNLKNARELFESTCSNSIFSTGATSSCTVQDVANNEKGSMRTGPFGSQLLKREIVDSGVAVLGIDNAVKNSFQWGAKRFITPEKFEELSRFEVKPKDVLITIMGTCGRCAIVPENIPKAINTKHLCCITLDTNKCLPEYLHAYFLYHPIAKEYLLSRAKGAIMAGLNMGIIKELPLVLPCIEEQKKLVSQVNLLKDNIDKLVMTYEAKLVSINELKKSILQKAFSGELTHK